MRSIYLVAIAVLLTIGFGSGCTSRDHTWRDHQGWSGLHGAAYSGNAAEAERILKTGFNPNDQTASGNGPLFYAINPRVVEVLLKYGADINFKSSGRTPLMSAIEKSAMNEPPYDHEGVVYALLAHGADVNIQGIQGRTALHLAVDRGSELRVVEALLAHGADVNIRDEDGKTPLDYALETITG